MSDQLALMRTNGIIKAHKNPKQATPATFLNKLYSMVNDPESDELIHWSEDGTSFFVPKAEDLARKLLPRFFKHDKFASFVRQLNMYGFHKVPQLQQGTLKAETETELWQFTNANFRRGQPDLLCLIQRKKSAASGAPSGSGTHAADGLDATPVAGPSGSSSSPAHPAFTGEGISGTAGAIALHSIAGELASIKRHQTSISSDLNTLQLSNRHLWEEAIAARERHKKHQDTINRILKFLAGVFGNSSNATSTSNVNEPSPDAGGDAAVIRRASRLMIDDGKQKGKQRATDFSGHTNQSAIPLVNSELDDTMSNRFEAFSDASPSVTSPATERTVDTPSTEIVNPSPFSPSDAVTMSNRQKPLNKHVARRSAPNSPKIGSLPPSSTPVPVDMLKAQSPLNNVDDEMTMTSTLASLLNSPSSLQPFLASLAQNMPQFAPNSSHSDPFDSFGDDNMSLSGFGSFGDPQNTLEYWNPGYEHAPGDTSLGLDLAADPNPVPDGLFASIQDYESPTSGQDLYHLDNTHEKGGDPALDTTPLANSTNELQRTYGSAQDIEADVENVQKNLAAIMESLGMDPSSFDNVSPDQILLDAPAQELSREGKPTPSGPNSSSRLASNAPTPGDPLPSTSMDIESLINHFNTATEHSFDSTQFDHPDTSNKKPPPAAVFEMDVDDDEDELDGSDFDLDLGESSTTASVTPTISVAPLPSSTPQIKSATPRLVTPPKAITPVPPPLPPPAQLQFPKQLRGKPVADVDIDPVLFPSPTVSQGNKRPKRKSDVLTEKDSGFMDNDKGFARPELIADPAAPPPKKRGRPRKKV